MQIKLTDWNMRNWIQLGIFVLTAVIGLQFYLFVRQASGEGPITIARPAGVEGFLPIGALMGWKRFVMTGHWDMVHPAAMIIFGFAALISWLFHKAFCSWICPVGTLSEWMWKFGKKRIGKNFKLHPWIDYPLRSAKYFLLAFFVYITASMGPDEIFGFMQSSYYKMADVKMLYFFTRMSLLTAIVLAILIAGSFLIQNFWCRYLCPYGALMGIFAIFSPTKIHRNAKSCINCEKCNKQCPSYLPVSKKNKITSPECIGCLSCMEVCPVEKTLQFKTVGQNHNGWRELSLGVTMIVIFVGIYFLAQLSGHWQSSISRHEFSMRLQMIDSPEVAHPKYQFRKGDK
jgi:polyferredoxin